MEVPRCRGPSLGCSTFCLVVRGQAAWAVNEGIVRNTMVGSISASFATLGRFDVVDIVEADDPKANRESGYAHPGLWAFDKRNTRCHPVEGVSLGTLISKLPVRATQRI